MFRNGNGNGLSTEFSCSTENTGNKRAGPAHSAALSRDLSEAVLGASCSACLFRALHIIFQ